MSLCTIPSLDEELFNFVFHINVYTYIPAVLKDEYIYKVLIESCNCLISAIKERNIEKIKDLADCLHNLPIYIAENNLSIPKKFWKKEVEYYRKKWDDKFLLIHK